MAASVDFTIAFEPPDEDGWIVARENVIDALQTVLTPDEELAGKPVEADVSTCASPQSCDASALRVSRSCREAAPRR